MTPEQALQVLNAALGAEGFHASRSTHQQIIMALETIDTLIKSEGGDDDDERKD